jgi:hypothetical protein
MIKCYTWSIDAYGAKTSIPRKTDQKSSEGFEMWCWRRIEKISWTDHVRNDEVLLRVSDQRNILHTVKRRNANWISHILSRKGLLKHVIEGGIEATEAAAG